MSSSERPRFSLVSAVYNVAPYLPDYIASLEAQTFPLEDVELILVDDGSTDDTPRLLREWARGRPDNVRVVRQENAGQSAARNTGLALARGEWVSFPDPDDALDREYLAVVDRFLTQHPDTALVAANRWIWEDETGERTNSHPLRSLFRPDRLVDLVADGRHFQGSAPAAFFRLETVRSAGLEYDTRVRPIFEDGHFTVRYLLSFDRPTAGFLGSAKYYYRKRSDASSTLQQSRVHPGRYSDVFEHGYLDVVRIARKRFGEVPRWLQSHLVFDMSWYFTITDSQAPAGAPFGGPIAERFHEMVAEVLGAVDVDEMVPTTAIPMRRLPRYVMQHGYRPTPWREPYVVLEELDRRQRLVRATYYFTGDEPREEIRIDGTIVEPTHGKTRDLHYAGRPLLHQRVMWLPAGGTLEISRDGTPADLVFERPSFPYRAAPPGRITWELSPDSSKARRQRAEVVDPTPLSREGRLARRLLAHPRLTRRYRGAWVLMDRIHDAADSGEVLFRWLRENRPDINAWFVLEKGSAEWKRFVRAGHADRLVAHGSLRWRLLMANADHLISSHADEAVIHPPGILEFTRPQWRFHFLQHGVIKDDLSAWLNQKKIDTFVTSTVQEHASIAGDHTPYVFTTREVQLTGLPRFDRLRAVAEEVPATERTLLLVAPTWRKALLPKLIVGEQRRDVDVDRLLESDFIRNWTAFLAHPDLATAARRHGLEIGFLPHPNLQPVLPQLGLPDHVIKLSYDGDIQRLFARGAMLVTDFSSVAFNAAYLDRPVVYFQFDEDVVLGGGHVGRGGYFDYRRDGFGPVTTTPEDAVHATVEALEHGPGPTSIYAERIATTFPDRDGKCCERVVDAVLRTSRNRSRDTPTVAPAGPPVAAPLSRTSPS